jgi:DNA-binding MarR family transcriptional regulator
MGEALKEWLKMKRDLPIREEVGLNLKVAESLVSASIEKLLSNYGITQSQYNVLRILKGVYPEGHSRCGIAGRMIERASDITRIIDRLEKQELVVRDRNSEDRRVSITRITEKGIAILNELNPLLEEKTVEITKSLTEEECRSLSGLLEKLYRDKM